MLKVKTGWKVLTNNLPHKNLLLMTKEKRINLTGKNMKKRSKTFDLPINYKVVINYILFKC